MEGGLAIRAHTTRLRHVFFGNIKQRLGMKSLGHVAIFGYSSLQSLCRGHCSKYVLYTSIVAGSVPARLAARVGRIGYDDIISMDVSGAINAQSDDLFLLPRPSHG